MLDLWYEVMEIGGLDLVCLGGQWGGGTLEKPPCSCVCYLKQNGDLDTQQDGMSKP